MDSKERNTVNRQPNAGRRFAENARRALLLFAMALATAIGNAQNTISLGYCNGEIATSSAQTYQGTGWASAAIRLPASSLVAYKGSQITAVRAALVQRINIDTLTVWVRQSLDGNNLASGTITRSTTPRITKGWNEVALDAPYAIGDADVYIGFSFRQRTNVEAISQVGSAMYNTSYVKLGDGAWTDVSADGQISVEAVVTGSGVPANDLGLTGAVVSPYPNRGEHALRVTAQVHNYGVNDVHGFSMSLTSPEASLDVHVGDTVPSTQSKAVTFYVDPQKDITDNTWTLAINGIDGATDEIDANNTISASYAFLKNAVIEEFTTEPCVNCPRVAGFLHQALEELDASRVFAVSHHAGYYTDKFTQDWDEPLIWLYSSASSSYAPAVLVDRIPEFTRNGVQTTAFIPASPTEIKAVVDYELEKVAEAVVGVQLNFNADSSEVEATVNLQKTENYLTESPRLTVWLIENHIATTDQVGADGTYYQEHVTRATNATWGDSVAWNGNTAQYSYTFAIDPAWDKSQMEVVAILGNYDAANKLNCVVDNAGGAKFTDGTTTGIGRLERNNAPTEVARYNILGEKLLNPRKGLNIIVYSDGSYRKVLVR